MLITQVVADTNPPENIMYVALASLSKANILVLTSCVSHLDLVATAAKNEEKEVVTEALNEELSEQANEVPNEEPSERENEEVVTADAAALDPLATVVVRVANMK